MMPGGHKKSLTGADNATVERTQDRHLATLVLPLARN